MYILAIETSCDETGIALLRASGGLSRPKFEVLENLVSSQIKIHAPFGGVVPNLAKREHLKNLPVLFRKIFPNFQFPISNFQTKSKIRKPKKLPVDLIAVTVGPGLEPALWTGINFAKELGKRYGVPVIGANHLEGHLYSFLLPQKKTISSNYPAFARLRTGKQFPIANCKNIFPAIALIVSGGHTILLLLKSFSRWKKLGETRDDAVGEAFDKVARLLKLPYPGGPEIEKLARRGNPEAISFPRPMIHEKGYDFSFSGLKTSVLYYMKDHHRARRVDVAASFQQAALDVLIKKTMHAAQDFGARSVLLSGGVAANKELRRQLKHEAQKLKLHFFVPSIAYNLDNAAMIGAAGYFAFLRKKKYPLSAQGNLEI